MKRLVVAACVALALLTCGCTRTATREVKSDANASGATAGNRKLNAAAPVRVSADGMDAAEPAITAGPDGAVYVAWVEHEAGGKANVWLARYDAGGSAPAAQPTRVNPNEGEATAWHGDPPTVAIARDGVVYVGWTARDEHAPQASTLNLSVSRDGGHSFGAPTKVNDDVKPGVHGMHSLALSADGHVYAAWLDERDVVAKEADPSKAPSHMHTESNREVYFATSADGGRTFSRNVHVASDVCPCCKTALAVADDGRVYAAWRQVLPGDYRHIAVASTTDGGGSFSQPVVVSDDEWQISGCPVSGAALSVATDGALRVLWYTAGGAGRPGLYWSESRDGGRTFAPRRVLAETNGRGTPVLLKGDGRALDAVWEGTEGASPAALTARLDGGWQAASAAVVAGGGELPAAVTVAGQLFVAYVAKEGEGHVVRLVRAGIE